RVWTLSRLKPGVSLQAAASDLDVVAHRLSKAYPKEYPANFSIKTMTLADQVVGQFHVMLFALMGAVSMLLLIACSNVANLLLARATAREKEIAIRASVGVTLVTTLLCGLAPAFHAVRGELHNRLKDTGKGTPTGFRHGRFRSGLVVSQVALSIVLLVGAGLMMRSLFALQNVDLGLRP